MADPRLVVFDLGRVLVRLCDGWGHACRLAGFEEPRGWPEPDGAAQARFRQLIHDFDMGRIDLPAFAAAVGPMRGLTAEQVVALNNAYLLGPFEGAGELIDEIHAAGHATACLSNTNANHWEILTDVASGHGAVLAKLGRRFASHLVGVRKPDAGIYEHLEREAGVAPSRIVFFDDMAENVEAARGRGWAAYLVEVCENPIPMIRARLIEERVL
jgi:putative hydrolase of the HAD superfamily